MKKRTRALSLFLAVVMVFSMFSMTVFAEETQTVDYEFWKTGFTKDTWSSHQVKKSGFTHGTHADWNTDVNGFQAYGDYHSYLHTLPISGVYTFQTEFSFSEATPEFKDSTTAKYGLTFRPRFSYDSEGALTKNYRIVLRTDMGLTVCYDSTANPGHRPVANQVVTEDSVAAGYLESGASYTINNDMTSFAVDTTYVLKYEIGGDYLYIKVWEKDKGESDGWDYMIKNSSSVGGERNLRIDAKTTETGTITVNNMQFTKAVEVAVPDAVTIADSGKGQVTGTLTGSIFDGAEKPELATPTVSYTSNDTSVCTVNSSTGAVTAKSGGSTTVTVTFSGDDEGVSVEVPVTCYPVARLYDGADDTSATDYFNFFMATRDAKDGGIVELCDGECGSITGQAAINNKTVTLTGTGSLANTINVAHPGKAELETNKYASAPATLIIKDASIINSSTTTDTTGFYVYHTNGHTEGDETYYLGTLQIVDSTVDVNAIWNAGTVEVSGENTELIVRKSFQIGAGAEKTAYVTVKDGALVRLTNDNDRNLAPELSNGTATLGEMRLENGGVFWFDTSDSYDIGTNGILYIDATSQFKSNGGINLLGTIEIDASAASSLAEGESVKVVDLASGTSFEGSEHVTINNLPDGVTVVYGEDGDISLTKAAAEEPEVTGSITNGTRSLSLDGAIIINQYVTIDGFEGIDLEANGGLLTFKEEVTEETATVENADYDQEGLLYDSSKDRYRAQSHGIAAKEYGDAIYLRAYVKDDNGNYYYGDLVTYSVREYCETALEKSSNQKLKNTCIAMLHYGAAAQVYFKYNTDKPANAGIAESYPNFDWDETLLDAAAEFTTGFETSAYSKISSKSLSLDGTILINFYSTVNTVTAAKVELLLWKGVTGELTLDNVTEIKDTTYDSAQNRYHAQSMEFAAKEYSNSIAACAKVTDTEGNEYYSEIVVYSPEVYAADGLAKSTNTNLHNLVKTMTIYGEKARIYFGA